jgi:hypothetical protein
MKSERKRDNSPGHVHALSFWPDSQLSSLLYLSFEYELKCAAAGVTPSWFVWLGNVPTSHES